MPPAISTLPFRSRVAEWPDRGSSMGAPGATLPAVAGEGAECAWNIAPAPARTKRTTAERERFIGTSCWQVRRIGRPRSKQQLLLFFRSRIVCDYHRPNAPTRTEFSFDFSPLGLRCTHHVLQHPVDDVFLE